MAQDYEVSTAYIRMGTLVDRIFQVVPNTAIIVSTLLPNANASTESNVLIYNENLIGMVAERAASGKKISLVDMSVIGSALLICWEMEHILQTKDI
jgi:hypothetical protein